MALKKTPYLKQKEIFTSIGKKISALNCILFRKAKTASLVPAKYTQFFPLHTLHS